MSLLFGSTSLVMKSLSQSRVEQSRAEWRGVEWSGVEQSRESKVEQRIVEQSRLKKNNTIQLIVAPLRVTQFWTFIQQHRDKYPEVQRFFCSAPTPTHPTDYTKSSYWTPRSKLVGTNLDLGMAKFSPQPVQFYFLTHY